MKARLLNMSSNSIQLMYAQLVSRKGEPFAVWNGRRSKFSSIEDWARWVDSDDGHLERSSRDALFFELEDGSTIPVELFT
jgi:hypothetical protein